MDALEAEVIERLRHDVRATLGRDYDALIRAEAANVRTSAYADNEAGYVEKVVEDVQQDFHDTFVDTTWPRCPRHLRHPLWYHGGFWWCEQDGVAVARLGELGRSATDHAS